MAPLLARRDAPARVRAGAGLRDVALKWLRRAVGTTAVVYPMALVGVTAMLRYVGESWWVSNAALYLPRILFALPLPFLCIALYALRMHRLLWLQIAGPLILVPLMGFVLPSRVSASRTQPSLCVLSFNIESGVGGVPAILDEIDRYSPDVVLLQEVFDREPLVPLLQRRFPSVEASNQFVLATRYRVVSTREPDELTFDGQARSPSFVEYALETPLGRIVVYNIHPISPREPLFALRGKNGLKREITSGHLFSGAGAPLLRYNARLRALQIERVAEVATKQEAPVIIGGDTNLPGLSPVLQRLFSDFDDGFTRAGWGFGYTFPANQWWPWMRIDRILANDRLRFVRFEVGRSRVSDHHCVVAELQAAEHDGPGSHDEKAVR